MQEGHTEAATITVLVASMGPASQWAWLRRLDCEPGIRLAADPVDGAARLVESLRCRPPDVLLLDKALLDRLDAPSLRWLHQQCDRIHVLLVLDALCGDALTEVLLHRFHGFLLAGSLPDACVKAIRAVHAGELWLSRACLSGLVAELLGLAPPVAGREATTANGADASGALSPREVQVVALLRRGYLNKQIAHELGIREDTVKKHLRSVFAKLGVHRRAQVMLGSAGHPEGVWQRGGPDVG